MMSFGSMVERGPHDKSLSGNRVCSREHAHRKKRNVHMITSEKKFIKFIVHVLAIDSEKNLFQQLILPVHQMHGESACTKWFLTIKSVPAKMVQQHYWHSNTRDYNITEIL
jgi:hypothetical protein